MKKRRLFYILSVPVILLLLLPVLVFLKKIHPNNWLAREYVKGVDVSHYQGQVDMGKLEEQGMAFAYIKATEGSSTVDGNFQGNWESVSRTGLLAGAYHFFSFDSSGKKQAKHYIETVGDLSGMLIPAVDVEYYGKKGKNPPDKREVWDNLTAFLDALEEEYGRKPLIYTTYKVYFRYIKGKFSDYPLWIRNVYCKPGLELGREWDFWQYSDTSVLEGYDGREKYIDCNAFCGPADRLQEYVLQGGTKGGA